LILYLYFADQRNYNVVTIALHVVLVNVKSFTLVRGNGFMNTTNRYHISHIHCLEMDGIGQISAMFNSGLYVTSIHCAYKNAHAQSSYIE